MLPSDTPVTPLEPPIHRIRYPSTQTPIYRKRYFFSRKEAKNKRVPQKEEDEPDEYVDDLLDAPDEAVLLSALAAPEDNKDDEDEEDDSDVRFSV